MSLSLKEVIEQCNRLDIYEQRRVNDEYAELVFCTKDLGRWNNLLTDIFGPPAKPQGIKPTRKDLSLTKDYGGIRDNQTLFKKENGSTFAIAMFWPWQDGIHTTLKMACLKK
jgi:hypothetical protein